MRRSRGEEGMGGKGGGRGMVDDQREEGYIQGKLFTPYRVEISIDGARSRLLPLYSKYDVWVTCVGYKKEEEKREQRG